MIAWLILHFDGDAPAVFQPHEFGLPFFFRPPTNTLSKELTESIMWNVDAGFTGVPLLFSTNPPPPEPDSQSPTALFTLSIPFILKPPVGTVTGAVPAITLIWPFDVVDKTKAKINKTSKRPGPVNFSKSCRNLIRII